MSEVTWFALFAALNAVRAGAAFDRNDWLDAFISMALVAATIFGIYLIERDDE